MAEKRYTVVFDAKDMASARLSLIEQQARKTSRGMEELARNTEKVSDVTTRLDGSYRDANGRLRDANGRFLKVTDAVRGTNTEVTRSGSLLSRMGSEFSRIGKDASSSFGSLASRLTGITGLLSGIATVASTAGLAITGMAAKGVVNGMIQPAMEAESTRMSIDGLSGDPKLGKKLYEQTRAAGMESMFADQPFMDTTQMFLNSTKDPEQISRGVAITERLATKNPSTAMGGGMEGAKIAISEAMSGDIGSIADRFNMSRSALKEAGVSSSNDWLTNLQAVDNLLSDQGFTSDYVKKINESTIGQWEKFKSNSQGVFASIGTGMLEEIRPALTEVNTLFADTKGMEYFTSSMSSKFRDAAADVFGLGDGVQITWKDITEWSKETFDGVAEVVESMGGTFTSTMSLLSGEDLSGPKEAFQSFGKVLSGISDVIDTINTGIKGMKEVSDWSDSYFEGVSNMNENLYGDSRYGLLTGWTKPIVDMFSDDEDGSHALGLSYVPKDNYRANLHEGERVLTKQENIAYTQGMGNSSSGGVIINIQSMSVRNEQDINAIGEQLVMRLKRTE